LRRSSRHMQQPDAHHPSMREGKRPAIIGFGNVL
jgi:hypothetical protein